MYYRNYIVLYTKCITNIYIISTWMLDNYQVVKTYSVIELCWTSVRIFAFSPIREENSWFVKRPQPFSLEFTHAVVLFNRVSEILLCQRFYAWPNHYFSLNLPHLTETLITNTSILYVRIWCHPLSKLFRYEMYRSLYHLH